MKSRSSVSLAWILAALLAASACSTTKPEEEPDDIVITEKPAPPPPPTDPRVSELQVLVVELLDRIEVLNARVARLEGGPVPAPPAQTVAKTPTPAKPPVVTASNVSERYREALALFGKGRIDDARAMFQQIYAADPNGELADNALYWIGETYYVTGKYNDALKHFAKVETDYPDQNKAPDAMLKVGMTYVKLGDLMLAKKAFHDLIEKHPYSVPAATAKAELNRIKY